MNKYKTLLLFTLFAMILMGCNHSRDEDSTVKISAQESVLKNQKEMTIIANEFLINLNDEAEIYGEKSECPKIENLDKLFKDFSISSISVEKNKEFIGDEYENRVVFYLNDTPIDKEYDECGIYYSPDNSTIDYYGYAVEEDENGEYVYDGRPQKAEVTYKSKRICDNWFYFQEAVW